MTSTEEQFAVQIRGVTKSFGRTPVLKSIDLDVPQGTVLSLLGPNGSGKTTLIRVLSTLTKPDAGEVRIGGAGIGRQSARLRRLIGVVGHDPLLYDDLTARENLRFVCRIFDLDRIDERVHSVSDRMGMAPDLDRKIGAMSHGMKKRFSIARALLHDPHVLLLDEPETGLDQEALSLLDSVIASRSESGRTVIMTTHNLERAVALGDRMAILASGRVAYDETIDAVDPDASRHAYIQHVGANR
ncbi:MAG: heme ABC exporter ATP-binding protein CcmA [Dehalococcoidia bacterium]|nr:heme ABC exporter ATP-binding protein CcmA [Dehalococcoidia bacterium]